MSAVLPPDSVLVDQSEVGFMDQRGGLQGVVTILVPHEVAGKAMQLALNQGNQPIERRLVTVAPID
jgi:hypothetical protein